MKRIELLICMLLLSLLTTGQGSYTTSRNYTVEKTYLEKTKTGTGVRSVINVTYYDGFRRKLQEIAVQGAPGKVSDIVMPYVYDVFGCVEREYLPYARLGTPGEYDANALAGSNWNVYGNVDAAYCFTLNEYDNSPLNRVVKQTGPGKAWQESGKGVTISYGFNEANEVRRYRASFDGGLGIDRTYPAGVLRKTVVTDEDSCRVETFTDSRGRVILAVSMDGDKRLETYSVYDARGLLRFVLSPEASAQLGATINETILQRLAYRYDYDHRGRLVVKHLPGCEPVYMVYDKKDRLVMSQDGKQRAENARKWSYSLHDGKNRVEETGEVVLTAATTHAALQSVASASLNYTPAGTRTALQYTLYDTYTATTRVPVKAFSATAGYASAPCMRVLGMVTSTRTRVLDETPEKWLTTTIYYDDRGRVIQTVSDNLHGRLSRVDIKYDFIGNVLQQRESHGVSAGQTDVLESVNTYDDRGRLMSSTVKLNNGTPATVTCTYDAVGRLAGKKYGNVEETMAYNARGWLTSKESTPFKMKLRYESPTGGSVARWNGNISEWEWQHGTSTALMYGFTYDGGNRLTSTTQKQKSGTTWGTLTASYLEKGLGYDRNGNIKTLQRTANGTMVDNLTYSYTGNQLTGLTEGVRTSPTGDIYSPGSVVAGAYSYDGNGNLTNDSRKALNLSYNVLNLLREVKTSSGVLKAKYNYLADGRKLRVRDAGNNGFDYLGSLTYKNSSAGLQLESANFGSGVIRANVASGMEVNYFLTDHLGSVRVIVDGSGVVKERNDYYPFGAKHARGDYPQLAANRYKYNGKEEQVTGDLGYLDYGWRMHDKALGRWFSMDKLSEMMPSISGYVYALNDPVRMIDLFGLYPDKKEDPAYSVLLPEVMVTGKRTYVPSSGLYWYYPGMKSNWDDLPDWDELERQGRAYSESQRVERDRFLEKLSSSDKYLSGSLGLVGIGIEGYAQIPHPTLRHYTYEFTKSVNKFAKSKILGSGKTYQGMQKLVKNVGKGTKLLGAGASVLQSGIIAYELVTDQWDAHTVVNGVLLAGGIIASFFAAPAVLIGIGVYGVADLVFDVGDKIDNVVGRNSGVWN